MISKSDRLTWTVATHVAGFPRGTVFAAASCALAGIRLSQEMLGCELALCSRGGAYDPRGPLSLHARWWIFNRKPRAYIDLKDVFDTLSEPHALLATPAQIDGQGRANLTCIGEHERPKVAFGGARGLPDAGAIHFVMPGYNKRQLVETVSFVSTSASARSTPALLMTEDFVLRWDHENARFEVTALAADCSLDDIRGKVGFELHAGSDMAILPEAPAEALALLKEIDPCSLRNLDFTSSRTEQLDRMGDIYAIEKAQIEAASVAG